MTVKITNENIRQYIAAITRLFIGGPVIYLPVDTVAIK